MPVIGTPVTYAPPRAGNLIRRGAAWLAGQLQQAAGDELMLSRNCTTIAELTAPVSRQTYSVADVETGVVTIVEAFDFTVRRRELLGNEIREGDLISGCLGTFEVLPLGDKPCVENLDTAGLMLTVHTKQVS